MRRRDWTAREIIALLLIATMTSSACSSGCRGNTRADQAAGGDPGRSSGATSETSQPAADAAVGSAAVPALDEEATAEALTYIEQVAKHSADAAPDLAAQAAALGKDPARIFAFIRSEIQYQVYDGVLRGAAGALSGRAANSWDTALLVAELLRKGGFEVRFARGTLPDASALALINRMFDQSRQPRRQKLSTESLQPPVTAAGVADAMRARIETNWTTNTAEVMAALKKAGIALGTAPPVSDATLLAEARDHAWVEYKDDLRWIPIDPVAATKMEEAATQARETFAAVPESKQHLVTFTLNVEQRTGGALETKPALTFRAPAADLHGQPILLAQQMDVTGSGAWKATPVLLVADHGTGGTPYGPNGIQATENTGAGGIGSRLNQMFSGASPASADLAAVWLDVTMTSPDGRAETVRREVLDRIGPVARENHVESTAPLRSLTLADNRPTALTAVMACALTAGPLSAATLAARVAAAGPVFRDEALRARLVQGDTKGIPDDRLKQIGLATSAGLAVLPQAAHLLSQQYAAEAAPAFGQPILLYEASPRLAIAAVGRGGGTDSPAGSAISLDLRRNTLRAVGRGLAPSVLIAANIARGVLDGAIEDALVTGSAQTVSAVGVLSAVRTKGIAIAASSPSAAEASGWSDAARARIRADQAPSVAVISPTNPVAIGGDPRAAWWRVDTMTGETIGALDNGMHGAQTFSEGVLVGVLVGMAVQITLRHLSDGLFTDMTAAAILFTLQTGAHGANAAQRGWNTAKNSF